MQYTVYMHTSTHKIFFYGTPLLLALFVVSIFVLSARANPKVTQDASTTKDTSVVESDTTPTSLSVPVLVYHHIREFTVNESEASREFVVTPAMFEKQMQYLSDNGYTGVLVKDLTTVLEGTMPLPENPVVVTFDDGRLNQYENALPVLTKYDIRATFFIFTNAVDANDKYLTSAEIRELDTFGHEIASHTILHPYLTRVDHELLVKELVESKAKLERIVGHSVVSLAYPFGLFNEAVVEETMRAGYVYARTLAHEYNITANNLLMLPGFIITNDFDYFLAIMEGKVK